MGFSFTLWSLVYAFAYQSHTASWRIIMKKALVTILIASALTLSACQPQTVEFMKVETVVLDTEQQKQSYAMGASIGQIIENKIANQKEAGVEYNRYLLVKGFIAALQGQSQLDKDEIQSINRAVEGFVREKKVEGLRALDLRTLKSDGQPWNFPLRSERRLASGLIDQDQPEW